MLVYCLGIFPEVFFIAKRLIKQVPEAGSVMLLNQLTVKQTMQHSHLLLMYFLWHLFHPLKRSETTVNSLCKWRIQKNLKATFQLCHGLACSFSQSLYLQGMLKSCENSSVFYKIDFNPLPPQKTVYYKQVYYCIRLQVEQNLFLKMVALDWIKR